MAQRGSLKASDEDRERVADRLREAAAEGRLLAHELEQRVATALRARTYGELDAVVADLPAKRGQSRPSPWMRPAIGLAIAVATVVVLAVAALIITGLVAGWLLWVALGWFFFGRHRGRAYAGRHRGRAYAGRHRDRAYAGRHRDRAYAGRHRDRRLSEANRGAVGGFTPWL